MSLYNRLNSLTREARCNVLENVTAYSDRLMEGRYIDALNEAHGLVSICGYDYDAAEALKAVDPVAYRCGLADYISDDETILEWGGTYYDAEALESALDDYDVAEAPVAGGAK